jgi:hypothetical protein
MLFGANVLLSAHAGALKFHEKKAEYRPAYVFYSVGRQGVRPLRAGDGLRGAKFSAIEQHHSMPVPANEIAPTEQVSRASAAMGVERHDCSRRDKSMEHTHVLIFHQLGMVGGRGDERVQRIGPRPRLCCLGIIAFAHCVLTSPWLRSWASRS